METLHNNLAFNSLPDDQFDETIANSQTEYITNSQFKDFMCNNTYNKDIFSLFNLNIRSINKHFDDLQVLLDNSCQCLPSIIGLTETWLSTNPNPPFALDGHDFIFNSRKEKAGGGVGLYVSKNYSYNVCNDITIMNDILESLFIEIVLPGQKNVIIGVVYRPPSSNTLEFVSSLNNILNNFEMNNKECFVMGDFNIDLLKYDTDNLCHEFLETFLSNSFFPLVSKPTRITNTSSTLIDNIFSNVIPHSDSYIILSDISDHYPIFTQFTLSNSIKGRRPRPLRRRVSPESIARLGASLEHADWSNVYNTDDVNTSYNNFLDVLNKEIDACIPLQKDKVNNYKITPRLPWISKSILRCINKKNRLYYKYKSDLTDRSKSKYTSYKNALIRILRYEKKKYFVNRLEFYKHDMQNTWKILKEAMNLVHNKNKVIRIKRDNEIIDDSNRIADIFNNHFSLIGETLAQNIPQSNKSFKDFLHPPNANSIFFVPTHKYEIIDIVSHLNNKKSSGFDNINNVIVKGIIPVIVDPLVHIFNLSFLNGEVPNVMKIAKVIPLFKKGDIQDVNNYRPISLLSSLSKVLEKLIHKRTLNFLKDQNILCDFQFGFRDNHSTSHALLSLVEKVAHALDSSSHMVGILLDFSKAFDTINHDILLHKLSNYGIRGKALGWFRSYLSDRKQFVFIDGHTSELQHVNCGVPQGSLLGPLLFIIYINDFYRSSDIASFILFADDTNLFFSHSNPNTLVEIVNSELQKTIQWIRANRLSLNLQKTKYILFSNSIDSLPTDLVFDDASLEKVSHSKFLGVIIDNKLSWKAHIDNIANKISRNIGILNRLKTQLPSTALLTLYSSLTLPYLNYGLLAWGNAHQTSLDKILLLQKRAVRIICQANFLAHTNPLFFEKNIFVSKRFVLASARSIHV